MVRSILRTLCFLVVGSPALVGQAEPWMDVNYHGRVVLSNLSPVGGVALTDFPVMIRLSNQAFLQQTGAADGGDLTFSGADGVQLFHEIEDFDRTLGNLTAWVCLPSFTNKTKILLYYGNPAASIAFRGSNATASLTVTSGTLRSRLISTNVWDAAFRLVLHFGEASGSPVDSSRYGLVPASVGASNLPGSNGFMGRYLSVNLPNVDYGSGRLPLRYTYDQFPALPVQFSASLWFNSRTPVGYVGSGLYMGAMSYAGGGSASGIGTIRLFSDGSPNFNTYGSATSPSSIGYNRWNHVAVFAGLVTVGPSVTNGTNMSITNGVVAKSNTSAVTMVQNYAPTADLTLGGNTAAGWASMPGLYDEVRISHTNRGPWWSMTEYSNTVLGETFFVLSGPQPGPLMSRLSNETTSPLPYVGQTVRLFLEPGSLSVPYRGANYITNISWSTTNFAGVGYTTNMVFAADSNAYTWPVTFGGAGLFSNFAVISDLSNGVWTNAPIPLRVFSNANFDLGFLSVRATNRGFILDPFGVNGAAVQDATLSFSRDGSPIFSTPLGNQQVIDETNLFYGTTYSYSVVARYPEVSFTNTVAAFASEPARVMASVDGGAGGAVATFEMQVSLPAGLYGGDLGWILRRPPDSRVGQWQNPVVRAFNEWVLEPASGVSMGFSKGIQVRIILPARQGMLDIPGLSAQGLPPLPLTDRGRIALAWWDGLTWRAVETRTLPLQDRVVVDGTLWSSGRLGILLLPTGEANRLPGPALSTRLLFPRGGDPERDRLRLSFTRAPGQNVRFRVISDRGRLVHENPGVSGNQVEWDLEKDGLPIPPGIYLYFLNVGSTPAGEFRGTFVIGRP